MLNGQLPSSRGGGRGGPNLCPLLWNGSGPLRSPSSFLWLLVSHPNIPCPLPSLFHLCLTFSPSSFLTPLWHLCFYPSSSPLILSFPSLSSTLALFKVSLFSTPSLSLPHPRPISLSPYPSISSFPARPRFGSCCVTFTRPFSAAVSTETSSGAEEGGDRRQTHPSPCSTSPSTPSPPPQHRISPFLLGAQVQLKHRVTETGS